MKAELLKKISPIEALCSQRNIKVSILTLLSREGSNFFGEDLSGRVKLNLKSAAYGHGLFFEGGVYIFDGIFNLCI